MSKRSSNRTPAERARRGPAEADGRLLELIRNTADDQTSPPATTVELPPLVLEARIYRIERRAADLELCVLVLTFVVFHLVARLNRASAS